MECPVITRYRQDEIRKYFIRDTEGFTKGMVKSFLTNIPLGYKLQIPIKTIK